MAGAAGFQFFQPPTGGQGLGAVAGAYQQTQGAMRDALATIQPGRYVGSGFGQGLLSRFAGQAPGMGISPEAMAAHRRQVSRQSAQNEAGELTAMRQAAASGGFGFSRGNAKAEADIRARSADTVQQSMDRLLIESEQQKRAQQGESLAALMQLYGIEGGLAAQYANIQASRKFPVIPGVTPEGQLPGGGYSFIDPQTGRMINPPRTDEEWEAFRQERMAWEQQYGGGGGGGGYYQPSSPVAPPSSYPPGGSTYYGPGGAYQAGASGAGSYDPYGVLAGLYGR